ncbi:hypothetical protein R1sor_008784 [Riccia sorocarpa]|uniref:Uncharacterized protein n=1 Tax=Riccia sorocarpa TaxID=122646 RepID=A0ABD3HUG7_9MARC
MYGDESQREDPNLQFAAQRRGIPNLNFPVHMGEAPNLQFLAHLAENSSLQFPAQMACLFHAEKPSTPLFNSGGSQVRPQVLRPFAEPAPIDRNYPTAAGPSINNYFDDICIPSNQPVDLTSSEQAEDEDVEEKKPRPKARRRRQPTSGNARTRPPANDKRSEREERRQKAVEESESRHFNWLVEAETRREELKASRSPEVVQVLGAMAEQVRL